MTFFAQNEMIQFQFKNEINAIQVVNALLWGGLAQDSLQLLYKTASNKRNITARQHYISAIHNYPDNLINEYEKVEINTFVKFQIERIEA